jgi:Zn-dependent protease with chaperone function
MAAACLYLPYLLLTQTHWGSQAILLFLCGVIMSGTLVWSVVPRRDRFSAPGPRLDASCHPRLFTEVNRLATALDEPLPQEVYLIPEVNAWVAERGGLMGFGSRRVMGLGLPLLQILTVSQFRAVLAHEFGHYYGGDTRLGPWVYKTRMAMVRALVGLGQPSALMSAVTQAAVARLAYHVVTRTLVAYWNLFLRTTQLVSRRQEYRADEIACYVVGSHSLVEGLQRIHRGSAALAAYGNEVGRILSAGYRPPIAEGFAQFIAANNVRQALDSQLEKELVQPHTSPYDSHPPLRDRLLAAGPLPSGNRPENDPAAISLLEDVTGLEIQMLELLNPKKPVASLKPARWENISSDVYVPEWKSFVEPYAGLLAGLTPRSLPEAVKGLREMGSHIRDPKGMLLTPEQRAQRAANLLGAALSLALVDSGWELHAEPAQLHLQRGAVQLDPFLVVSELARGTLTGEAWLERAKALGIEDLRLDRLSPPVLPESGRA